MGWRGLAVLVAAAAGACTPDLPRAIHIDSTFSADEVALCQAAIDQANARLGEELLGHPVITDMGLYTDPNGFTFDDFGDDISVIYAVSPTSPEYEWLAQTNERAYEGYGTLADILITDRLTGTSTTADRAHFQQVVMHELGHFLGLPHASEQDAIMYSGPGRLALDTYTDVDQQTFCLVYGC